MYLSASSALRLDCTVSGKRVKKKTLFGNAGCPSFSVFRFSGKKIPFRIRAVGKSIAKRKINLETLAARVILTSSLRTRRHQTKNKTKMRTKEKPIYEISRVVCSPVTGCTLHIMARGGNQESAKEEFYRTLISRPESMESAIKAQRAGLLRITLLQNNCRKLIDASPFLIA